MRLTYDQRHYSAYMRSPEWARKRAATLNRQGRYCRSCGTTEQLHVHHRSYANLGRETNADLVVLCETCHTGVHQLTEAGLTLAEATDKVIASPNTTPRVVASHDDNDDDYPPPSPRRLSLQRRRHR